MISPQNGSIKPRLGLLGRVDPASCRSEGGDDNGITRA
jgi:hypothetical protein